MIRAAHRGGLAGWQVRRMHELAAGDLAALSPTVMAREVRLSAFHFSRAFQASMGDAPGRWLTRLRVERARELLDRTDLSIGEIARQVGYSGAPQLARAFRVRVGVCPQAYKRR